MSGPTGAIIVAEPLAVLISALLTRAAEALREGYAEAERLGEAHRQETAATRQSQQEAATRGLAELQTEAQRAEAETRDLLALAARLGVPQAARARLPAAPGADAPALAAYLRAMENLRQALRGMLLTEAARRQEAFADTGMDLAALLPAAAQAGTPSQRWLARIAHLGSLPKELTELARELDACLPGERAALLATELRLQVQRLAEEAQQKAVQEATGVVVEQTLKELGYQVEPIAETIFVSGGLMHFRRADWGDYMVRLRADPKSRNVNFNVVRAVDVAQAEVSELDHLAEDRWCAEFPALLKALEAQGVKLQVTRRLEAGEVPVQQVQRSQLPQFTDEEAAPGRRAARLRSLS